MKKASLHGAIWIVALALLLTAGLLSGRADAAEKLVIAVVPKGTTHEFWKSVHAGAIKAQRKLQQQGTQVELIWKGPIKEDDRDAQISVVENLITRGVSGIVLAPLDNKALRMPVAGAVRANIPVVIFDSALDGQAGKDFVSFVATDNHKGGAMAGAELARLLGGKGKVIMLRYQEGSASTMAREQGFLDAIAKHQEITVVSANQYGGATTESAYQASENLLATLKTDKDGKAQLTVDGIFCPNESTTFGMLRALQDGKLAGGVRFVGFDSSEKLVQALRDGQIQGLILQNPLKMGYQAVLTLAAHLQGKKVEERIDTGVTLVTKENMDQEEVAQLLKPELDKYLK